MKTFCTLALLFPIMPLDDSPKPSGDLGKMQGRWESVGTPKFTLKIDEDRVEIVFQGGPGRSAALQGKIKIDEKASPKSFDFVDFVSATGQPIKDRQGLYEFKEDKLRMAIGNPGGKRPDSLEAAPGADTGLQTWKRIKGE